MSGEYMPVAVDEPQQILLWGADEIAPMFAAIGLGIFMDKLLIFFLLSLVYIKLMRKYKDSRLKSYGIHMLWWWGVVPVAPTSSIKDPFQREWHN